MSTSTNAQTVPTAWQIAPRARDRTDWRLAPNVIPTINSAATPVSPALPETFATGREIQHSVRRVINVPTTPKHNVRREHTPRQVRLPAPPVRRERIPRQVPVLAQTVRPVKLPPRVQALAMRLPVRRGNT